MHTQQPTITMMNETSTPSFAPAGTASIQSLQDLILSKTPLTQNLCLEFVRRNGLDLEHVPPAFRSRPVLLDAVRQNGMSISFFQQGDWNAQNAATESGSGDANTVGSEIDNSDPFALELALCAATQNGSCLGKIPQKLRTVAVIKAGLEQDGWALQFLQPEEITHGIRLVALQQSGYVIRYIEPADRTPDLCLAAILNAFPSCKVLNLNEYIQEGSERLQGMILANWAEFEQIQGLDRAKEIRQVIESSSLFNAAQLQPSELTNLSRLTLNDMVVLPGTPLQIRNLAGNSIKRQVQFIGSVPYQGVLIAPCATDSAPPIEDGDTYIVQGFTGKHSFSFLAKILHAIDTPFTYSLIEYPVRVDSVRVRSALRTKSDWPACVLRPHPKTKNAFIEIAVRIHDLSLKGARVVSDAYIGYIGQQITLHIKAQVNADAINVSVQAAIRHISKQNDSSNFYTGVEFAETSLEGKMAISYLLSTQPAAA